jgi:hypothetical protein
MRSSRFVSLLLVVAAAALSPIALPGASVAQGPAPVTVRLRSQSAWNGATKPLVLSFTATNTTDQMLSDLSVVLSIGTPTISRSAYEQSLKADQTAFPFALPFGFDGAMAPGETRTFSIRHRLETYPQPSQSGLYPLKIQLLSENVPRATLRTAMVFLVETPEVPLNLIWTWVLDATLQQTPSGVIEPGPLPGALSPAGRIGAMVNALDAATPRPVDVVVSPQLTAQLEAMAGGYATNIGGQIQTVSKGTGGAADAADVLDALRRVAGRPGTELVALPFGDARIPSLIRSGLGADVDRLMREGRTAVSAALGTPPDPAVFRPPLSHLDPASAGLVSTLTVRTVLVDPGTIPLDAHLPFGPPAGSARPLVRLLDSALFVVTPDPGVAAVASEFPGDPRLAAQAALGELAAVWLEFPGTTGRGASVMFSETSQLDPAFFGAFAGVVAKSPWLHPSRASDAVADTADEPPPAELPARSYRPMNDSYRRSLLETRRSLAQFGQAVKGASELTARLQSNLLLAEGAVALTNPTLGSDYVASVRRAVEATYRRVRLPPSGSGYTLTSKGNFGLPLKVSNESPYPMRVAIRVVSDRRLLLPNGNVREVTLPAKRATLVSVRVRAAATGRFPVKVQILTTGTGPQAIIAETDLVIRSTAYNRIALFLTIGAAVFLLAWWGRGFLPGRRRERASREAGS